MSFINNQLREFIIKNFMGEQISITKTKELEENELDTFIEMPIEEKTKEEEPKKTNIKEGFRYLDGDLLSKEFSLQREDEILDLKKYTMKLCLFNLNERLSVPFLEFFFDNKTGEFDFPQKDINMEILAEIYKKENDSKINMENINPFQNIGDTKEESKNEFEEESEDEFEVAFFSQCSQFFQEITFLTNEIAVQRYLGFIEKDNIIYIVFDCTDLDILENIHLQKKEGYFIAIIDEILNKKKLNETNINGKIIELFEETPLLSKVYNNIDNIEVASPKLVYLCIQDETGYKNDYYENLEETKSNDVDFKVEKSISKSQSPVVSIINPKVTHPLFDNVYLFTTEPFITSSQKGIIQEAKETIFNNTTTDNEINNIKRFALELKSVKYYKDFDIKTLIEKNEIINPNYDIYCFYDDGREFWAVRTITTFVEI